MGDVCSNRSCCDSRWRVASLRPSKLAVQLGLMFQTEPTSIGRTLFVSNASILYCAGVCLEHRRGH